MTDREWIVRDLGRQPYEPVWRAMQRLTDARGEDTADELWLVEHDPVFTLGQAGKPTPHHHPVIRYWTPEEFKALEVEGLALGFTHVASGPMVRSSYHADRMAAEAGYVAEPA